VSELNPGAIYALEAIQPIPDIEQSLMPKASVASDQYDARGTATMSEMPTSHPDINAEALTIDGLIKVCPHYAKLAETNPELAKTEAAEVVHRVQERDAMREAGMSDGAIKKQQWSVMRERHKEKVKTEESLVPEKAVQDAQAEPAQQHTTEQPVAAALSAERSAVPVRDEVIERMPMQRAELTAALVRDHAEQRVVAEQIAPQAARVVSSEVEQTHVATVEAVSAPILDRLTNVQDAAAAAYERMRFTEQPEAMEHTVNTDHESAPDVAVSIEAERAALPNTLSDDYVSVESAPFSEPGDAAGMLFVEELSSLPGVTEPDLGNDEAAEYLHGLAVSSEPQLSVTVERQTWNDVLGKEPLELYDEFIEALQSLTPPPEEMTVALDGSTGVDEPALLVDAIQELQPPPAIAAIAAERLAELGAEERESAAPLLKEIVEVVQIVTGARPETIQTAQTELEELVTVLFEQLGIAHESEDVDLFVALLLSSDFQPPQAEEITDVDLEYDGTREAKLHIAQFVSDGLSDVEEAAELLLGKIVLFYTAHHSSLEYEPMEA